MKLRVLGTCFLVALTLVELDHLRNFLAQWPLLLVSLDIPKLSAMKSTGNKTAVVVTGRYLTNCSAARLHHLVSTTPPEIDVWFLHDHARYPSNSSEVTTSVHHLQSLMQSLGMQHAAKENRLIPGFDTAQSRAAKSSFLRWMTQHSDQYQYAWHVEDDVFYTGLWSDVFRAHERDTADLVATQLPFGRTWMWAQNTTCRIKYSSEMFQHTNFTSMECIAVIRLATHWAMLRLSQSFATHLLEDLESGFLFGHHEAVVFVLLQVKPYNLTYSKLQHVGRIMAPNKRSRNMTLDSLPNPVLPRRLYHPVKCQAYQTDLTPLLQQMVYHVNYSNPNMVYPANYSSPPSKQPLYKEEVVQNASAVNSSEGPAQ